MENTFGKVTQIAFDRYSSFLSEKSIEIAKQSLYNTTIEILENDNEYESGYRRQPYLVGFLCAKIKNEHPTTEQIQKFCGLINQCADCGDIFYGNLAGLHYMGFNDSEGNRWTMLSFYPVCKLEQKTMFAKYPFFKEEGILPTYILE